ncbi:MAG: HigA family addiction module antitoxin [Bacillota bacterium]|nr:HigA family addiction module antitoxin [Bacillota bacterium]MDW7676755.1 HigA family addiction module antitoxin [Bacillota bacterium]
MVNKKDKHEFMPVVAVPPGDTIKENMAFLGMNQKELAARLDISEKHLSQIMNGHAPIMYDTALKLEDVIGPSAEFWMNLEVQYQLTKARLEGEAEMQKDLEFLKCIPYKEMMKRGWIGFSKEKHRIVESLRKYYGVAHLDLLPLVANAGFRKHKDRSGIDSISVATWLRKAEMEAAGIYVEAFSKRKLKSLISRFRELTMEKPEIMFPELQELCASCGVALVVVEDLPKTYICGATIWKKDKAILALSVRGKRADSFWFTFFHEIAHLLLHDNKTFHIHHESKGEKSEEHEKEANRVAGNYLIPEKLYLKFIDRYEYRNKEAIVDYSNHIGIAPCILLGRLQHDRYLGYQMHNELKPSFEIKKIENRLSVV